MYRKVCYRESTLQILTYFFYIPTMFIVFINTILSLFKTTYFELYRFEEVPYYKNDHPLIVLIMIILFFVTLAYLQDNVNFFTIEFYKMKNWYLFAAGCICLFFVLIFRGTATCDSLGLSNLAVAFLSGNGNDLQTGGYLSIYPFQLGMVAVLELVYTIFGAENYMAFQIINITAILTVLYVLHRITEEIFNDKEVVRYEEILSVCMLPLFLYSTFVYGDILGLACSISAVYFEIRFLKDNRYLNLFYAAMLISAAIIIKSNNNIIMVAMVIILCLKWLSENKILLKDTIYTIIAILGIVLIPQICWGILGGTYCKVFDIGQMPKGTPKLTWIAMSLQEDAPYEYGWYNGYNYDTYVTNGFDRGLTQKAAVESIKNSLGNFAEHPDFAFKFFYRKFVSQWNASDFQSLITNEWSSRHSDNLSYVAYTLLYGTGRKILGQLMNLYHLLIYLCTSMFFIKYIKRIRLEQAFLVLCILGGILFHLIWEAQARYALPYFVIMLPLAASGMKEICSMIIVFSGSFRHLIRKK